MIFHYFFILSDQKLGGNIIKVGVISDTHLTSVEDGFERFVEKYFSDVDVIVHAGDFVDFSVAEFFSNWALSRETKVIDFFGVSGNMDMGPFADTLPRKRVLDLGGKRIGVIHGWGAPNGLKERVMDEFNGVDCIIFGHTHSPLNMMVGDLLLFNPGTPTDKRFSKDNTIGYLTIEDEISGEIVRI